MSFSLLLGESKLDKRVLPSFSDRIGIKIEVLLLLYPEFMQTEPKLI
tara:strand:+ start:70 stop:210 length:141 start_codon:yes stop_codon:yes gene_type:complete